MIYQQWVITDGPSSGSYISVLIWWSRKKQHQVGRLQISQLGQHGRALNCWLMYLCWNVAHNKVGDSGCKFLSRANWRNMKVIKLGRIGFTKEFNQINDNCCRYLSKAAWKKLKTIHLGYGYPNSDWNKIGDRGCKHICEGGWPQIKAVGISIGLNNSDVCCVREEGCRSMAKLIEYLRILWCIFTASQVNSIKLEWLAMASWMTSMGISSVTINTRNRTSFDQILIWLYLLGFKLYFS